MHILRSLGKTAIVAASLAGGLAMASGAAEAAFECPWKVEAKSGISAEEAKALFQTGNPLDNPDKLNETIDALRGQGAPSYTIIDNLIGAYCPVVVADTSLNDTQKANRVQRFAARITSLVYSVEGADEIILNVPLAPDAVDAVNARSRDAKISPEQWVAETVDKALAATP